MAVLLDLIPNYPFNLESLPDSKWMTMFFLGIAMGFRHATDADHVVAVSTIVSESKNKPTETSSFPSTEEDENKPTETSSGISNSEESEKSPSDFFKR